MKFGRTVLAFGGLGAAIGLAVLAMPRAEPPLVTIPGLIAHHAAFDRQAVRVRGFLSQCADENCALTSAPYDRRNPRGWHDQGGRLLSIGPDRDFDRQTAGFVNRAVVMRARFHDDCLRPRMLCFDRAPTLQPLGRRPILSAEEI